MSDDINTFPSLFIEEIRVLNKDGRLALKLEFRKGINVVLGESSSGRTTLLRLIEYILGKRLTSSNFIPEIAFCEKMVAQIKLNNKTYTIERKFGKGSGQIIYYQGFLDDALRPEPVTVSVEGEFSNFLLFHLGIPRLSFFDERSDKERVISFSDIYSALYIDQDYGFSEIHSRLRGESKRVNVLKLLLGISILDLYEVEAQEVILRKQRDDKIKEYNAVAYFLGSLDLPSSLEFSARSNELLNRKSELLQQQSNLRSSLRSQSSSGNHLRSELLELESQVTEKRQSIIFARQTLNSYILMRNQLEEDIDKIERIRVASIQLSSYEFDMCPRCLQQITDDMKAREHDGNCSVCGQSFQVTSDSIDDISIYEQQIKAQIQELNELEKQYNQNIIEDELNLQSLQERLSIARQELDESMHNYIAPVVQEIENFGYQLAKVDEEIYRISEFRRWNERLQEMQNELKTLDEKLDEIRKRKIELQEAEKSNMSVLRSFESFFVSFVQELYPGYRIASIDNSSYLPFINGHIYKSKSAVQRNITILGYYYALLRYSLELKSNIPKILVIDTIRQDDLSNDLYIKILKKFKELEVIYGNNFQLLLVIREEIDFLVDDEILNLTNGRYLLQLNVQ